MTKIVWVTSLLAITISLSAQPTRLLRQPDIHGTQVVFAYASDLWLIDKNGGEARRLTSFPGVESEPHFSPDGSQIAFTGTYGDNYDVYVVPTTGGEPKRLTWHPEIDQVRGWTRDGKVLFSSYRTSKPSGITGIPQLWTIGLHEGLPQLLPLISAYRGSFSADGRFLAYEPNQQWDNEWRNYRGGQIKPINILELTNLSLSKIPSAGSRDMQPLWLGDQIYFLSDRDTAMNLYRYDVNSKAIQQLTFYADFDIKYLSGSQGTLVYEYGGDLYLFDLSTEKPRKLQVSVKGDFPWMAPHWVKGSEWAKHASLSPTGQRTVLEVRGEIITVPAKKGDARNITNSPGTRDQYPVWSPDGKKIAWFSDRSGEYALVVADQDGLQPPREIIIAKSGFYYSPVWSPDSKCLAFTDHLQQLWITDISAGTTVLVDKDTYLHPERTVDPVWSPDSRFLAYAKRLPSQYHVIMAYDKGIRQSRQLTDGMSDAVSPAWDAGGKYLYFLASTNYALRAGWLDMSSLERPIRRSVYLMVLKNGVLSPLSPESDEEGKADKPEEQSVKPAEDKKGKGKTSKDSKTTSEPASPCCAVEIDYQNINQRILSLDMPEREYVALKAGPEGILFVAEVIANETGNTLHKFSLKDRKAKKFLSGVQEYTVSADGKKLLYQAGSNWTLVETTSEPVPGEGTISLENVTVKIDPRQEWKQMFREAWRYQRDFLYVNNVHGANWNKIYEQYAPLVDHVAHRRDLNYLLDILGGEVSIGHSFVGGGDVPKVEKVNIGLLGADLELSGNRYRIKKIYSGENWNPRLRAPLSMPGVDILEGDYLIAVDGKEVLAPASPYSYFENKADKQVVLKVSRSADGKDPRQFNVVPVASEDELRIFNWVESNRRKVDSLSNGQLAYVWLPNTSEQGYTYFNRYYFAQQDKKGVILDERFNGGGFIADYFVDILNRKLRGYFNNVSADHQPWTEPLTGIFGPKVMLINEMAGSGGDMLPYMFREMKLGTLVGSRTWGGLVGIWDTPELMDGGTITAPRGGFFNLQGEWDVENKGVPPDIAIEMEPALTRNGGDPQLEKAVEVALQQLKEQPVQMRKEPAPPIRSLRPTRKD